MARDKSHMESVEKWAEFVKTAPRERWKNYVTVLINSQYKKADEFYDRLKKTKEGKEILERLKEERIKRK